MKKAMIVQPMNGLGEEQILEARTKAVAELERRGYEVVDTYFKDGLAVPHKVVNEPPSGWNLPPGCFEGDPNAPWNQEEPEPCCECRWFKPTDGDDGVCGLELEVAIANEELAGKSMADAANKAVDWALDHLKDGDEIACEHFKP